jgi:hypothetical protein
MIVEITNIRDQSTTFYVRKQHSTLFKKYGAFCLAPKAIVRIELNRLDKDQIALLERNGEITVKEVQ